MKKPRINFFLDNKNDIKDAKIFLDIRYGDARVKYFIGYCISSVKWSLDNQAVVRNALNKAGESFSTINDRIDVIRAAAELAAANSKPDISSENLKIEFLKNLVKKQEPAAVPVVPTIEFFSTYDTYVRTAKVVERRRDHLTTVKNQLTAFIKEKKRGKMSFEKFNVAFLTDFDMYLSDGRSRNTVISKMKILRAFAHYSIQRGYIKVNPFITYKVQQERYLSPIYLTKLERDSLYEFKDLSKKLERVRDVFIFQCMVGCRVGDMNNFTKSNVIGGFLVYSPEKTRTEKPAIVRVPLSVQAKSIIEKYSFLEEKLIPTLSSQKYNTYLRELFRHVGLVRPVVRIDPGTNNEEVIAISEIASSHMARRTFIGILHKTVKNEVIGSMSGHSVGSKAFDRYYNIDDEDLMAAIDTI
jgi:site-specific recombinase XerD